jgi:mRNA-degrading endonuclease RelE of RelBE toxin-antitoxin system
MHFEIEITASAELDLKYFAVFERRVIVDGIKLLLTTEADIASNRRKPLQPNSVAAWELRLGDFRGSTRSVGRPKKTQATRRTTGRERCWWLPSVTRNTINSTSGEARWSYDDI